MQIRTVVAALAGDIEAAERVELVLPDAGVYGGSGLYDDPTNLVGGGGCCVSKLAAPPALELATLGAAGTDQREVPDGGGFCNPTAASGPEPASSGCC